MSVATCTCTTIAFDIALYILLAIFYVNNAMILILPIRYVALFFSQYIFFVALLSLLRNASATYINRLEADVLGSTVDDPCTVSTLLSRMRGSIFTPPLLEHNFAPVSFHMMLKRIPSGY